MIGRLERRDGKWGISHRQFLRAGTTTPAAEHWMQGGLLAPDPSVLRMSAKYPTDPVDAHANPTHTTSPNIEPMCSICRDPRWQEDTICAAVAPDAVFTVRT
jgi:hypothetical protein